MKISRFLWAFVLMLLGLTACSNQSGSVLSEILVTDKPTLLFFYTEN